MKLATRITQLHSTKKQHFFFLFGAPGVGKGTYAKLLTQDFQLSHISTGDEIRKYLKKTPESNVQINLLREIVRSGGLVNDAIALQIVKQRISQSSQSKGIILDGFPRNRAQLELYLQMFPLNGVLNFTLREDILFDKLMGRRACLSCNVGYNLCNIQRDGYSMEPILPKQEGICDHCGGKLVTREDDNETVIKARLEDYRAKTQPLLKTFEEMGVLMSIEPKFGVKDYPKIRDLLKTKMNTQ